MTDTPGADVTDCAQALASLQTLLDGELDHDTGTRILGHLEACPPCELEADFYRRLKRAITRCAGDLDPAVLARLERFADRVPDAGPASPS